MSRVEFDEASLCYEGDSDVSLVQIEAKLMLNDILDKDV